MSNFDELKKSILADGIIDAQEVKQLREILYADGKIDKDRVTHVCLCVINNIRTISMNIDGYPVWLAETKELTNWFGLSGIFIEDRTTAEAVYNFTPEEIEDSKKHSDLKLG